MIINLKNLWGISNPVNCSELIKKGICLINGFIILNILHLKGKNKAVPKNPFVVIQNSDAVWLA
ncbi:unnamed protein product [Moneuplotes crassus]|uniref:Uncharacterized protein n=1 Tax=Euplotes crassus TaxID=5936 RepID=A0AAD1XTC6_EUPCR|nr:unnamed protein product [Moneuplotes crassus]